MSKPTYLCKYCNGDLSQDDKICPHCKADLSKVGRNISLTVSDYIKLSDKLKIKISPENVKWDSQSLTFLGVIATIFLGIAALLISLNITSVILAFVISFLITVLSLVAITKVKLIKNLLIKLMNWFLK